MAVIRGGGEKLNNLKPDSQVPTLGSLGPVPEFPETELVVEV